MKRLILILLLLQACSPASVTQIGPPLPPRRNDCEIKVLSPGNEPDRPYRDVGMVALANCQDYEQQPCRNWLVKEACMLGGDVAYLRDEFPERSETGPVTYRVMVAAYLVGLRPVDGDQPAGDCSSPAEKVPAETQRCTE